MADFVENLKKGAGKALDNAENITKAAFKKTSESVNTLKLKYSLRDIESDINALFSKLGEMLYCEFSDGAEFNGEYLEICEKIAGYYEEIAVLKAKIAELSGKCVCPACGGFVDADARFCPSCGKELADDDAE